MSESRQRRTTPKEDSDAEHTTPSTLNSKQSHDSSARNPLVTLGLIVGVAFMGALCYFLLSGVAKSGQISMPSATIENDLAGAAESAPLSSAASAAAAAKRRMLTEEELAKHSSKLTKTDVFLAILGEIYNVTSGGSYQDGGGYAFFTGKDGSAAFVTGKFDAAGLVPDVRGLKNSEVLAVWEWADFYRNHESYKLVGYLIGLYYNELGEQTQAYRQMNRMLVAARKERDAEKKLKEEFPGCNMRSSQSERVFWCEDGSAGIKRGWAGLPRKFHAAGTKAGEERCVCAQESKLSDARLRLYDDCAPTSPTCVLPPIQKT